MKQQTLFPATVIEFVPGERIDTGSANVKIDLQLSSNNGTIEPHEILEQIESLISGEKLSPGIFTEIKKLKFNFKIIK